MFSKELEALIEASLADGKLDDNEKAALVNRAQKEGVDLAELEIYINSILQKRMQTKTAEEDAREEALLAQRKKEMGKVCPHCGQPIPPLVDTCPNCGKVILTAAVNDKIEKKMAEVKKNLADALAVGILNAVNKAEALGKANLAKNGLLEMYTLYSSVPKVQAFYNVMNPEIENNIKKIENTTPWAVKMLKRTFLIFFIIILICVIMMAVHK